MRHNLHDLSNYNLSKLIAIKKAKTDSVQNKETLSFFLNPSFLIPGAHVVRDRRET